MRIFAHIAVAAALVTCSVALYLNRRLWPFTALNSWTGSLSTAFQRRCQAEHVVIAVSCHQHAVH